MIVTILEANLEPGREADLEAAYSRAVASGNRPPGLVRSELLRDAFDPARWRIQTVWQNRQVLEDMRGTGTPAGILMFRSAGAEPQTSVFEVVDDLPPVAG
jgi:quinol monooxygenase YgiN